MAYKVEEYIDPLGNIPFRLWFDNLDKDTRLKIQGRMLRFEQGNLGDIKSIGGGIWEARIHFGPGYRIYFGKSGKILILFLVGGSKKNQQSDIKRAKKYWKDFKEK